MAPLCVMARLSRIGLSAAVAFSAVSGFVTFHHAWNKEVLFLFTGMLLLSGGASALNQYQERHADACMERTRNRPLPAQHLSTGGALAIAAALLSGGLIMLGTGTTWVAAGTGMSALILYNGIYTPLKKKTGFAVVPGAMAGALPPLIGATAAGGPVFGNSLCICLFMFLWQMAHVVLLASRYGTDYAHAGFHAPMSTIHEHRFRGVLLLWVAATAGSATLFPRCGIVSGAAATPLFAAVMLFPALFAALLFVGKPYRTPAASFCLYLFQGIILMVLAAAAL